MGFESTGTSGARLLAATALAAGLLLATGCGRHRNEAPLPPPEAYPPAAQPLTPEPGGYPPAPAVPPPARIVPTPAPPGGVTQADLDFIATHRPILSQSGLASWYAAPYRGRRAANGQVLDNNAMTAAHRTLPMGTLIVVTNLRTGQAGAMRVTDRGPFVRGRIVDLTVAAAKVTGVYGPGLAPVRLDVYEAPKPIAWGGRWCVQIGAFTSETRALRLKQRLMRQYPEAQVIEFSGEASYWVRLRPMGDDRARAEYIARHVHPSEGYAFLTRLD